MSENDPNPSPSSEICEDKEEFEIVIPDNILRCIICHDFLLCPITTPCGHTFCKHCLVEWLTSQRSDPHTCPACRFSFPSSYNRRFVESCKSDVLSNHILAATCYIRCPNGCSAKIHPGLEEVHNKSCPETTVSCVNEHCGCTENIKRKRLVEHSRQCQYFPCRARQMGCDRIGTETEIAEHERTCRTKCVKDYIDNKLERLIGMGVHSRLSSSQEQQSSEQTAAWALTRLHEFLPRNPPSRGTTGGMNLSISHVNALGSMANDLTDFLEG